MLSTLSQYTFELFIAYVFITFVSAVEFTFVVCQSERRIGDVENRIRRAEQNLSEQTMRIMALVSEMEDFKEDLMSNRTSQLKNNRFARREMRILSKKINDIAELHRVPENQSTQ